MSMKMLCMKFDLKTSYEYITPVPKYEILAMPLSIAMGPDNWSKPSADPF